MTTKVTPEDEGKDVIDANGEQIGTVEAVDDGTAFVEPISEVDATVTLTLGWTNGLESEAYPLQSQSIDTITDSTIYLRSNL